MKRKVVTGAAIAVIAVAVVASSAWSDSQAAAKSGAAARAVHAVARGELVVTLTEQGTLVAEESKYVKPEVEGEHKITYLIDEGTQVAEGTVVVKLDTKEVVRAIEQVELEIVQAETALDVARTNQEVHKTESLSNHEKAKIELDKARKDLERYRDGDALQERRKLEIAIKDAETTLARAKKRRDDSQRLVEQQFVKPTELEDHQLEFEKATVQLDGDQLALRLFEKYTFPMTIAEKEAAVRRAERELDTVERRDDSQRRQKATEVEQAQKRLDKLKEQLADRRKDLEKMEIKSPVPGVVVWGDPREPWSRSEIRIGASVWQGYTILTIPDLRVMQVELKVHEADVGKLAQDQSVRITMDTYPGVVLDGKVTRVAQVAGTRNQWGDHTEVKVFDVDTTITDAKGLSLKPGISAKAEILIARKPDVLSVPLQCVIPDGAEHWCWVETPGGPPERRAVQVGLTSDHWVEVQGGLEPGERVLLYDPDLPPAGAPAKAGDPEPARPEAPTVEQEPPTR